MLFFPVLSERPGHLLCCPPVNLAAQNIADSVENHIGLPLSIVPYQLGLVLCPEYNADLVAPCRCNEVVKPLYENGRHFVKEHSAMSFPFLVYDFEHPGSKYGKCSPVYALPFGVIADTDYFGLFRIVYVQIKIVGRQNPVQCRRYELVQRYLGRCYLPLKLLLRTSAQSIDKRFYLDFQLGV